MIARINAADSMPTPSGGPLKSGRLPSAAGVAAWSWRTSGTSTNTPHRP